MKKAKVTHPTWTLRCAAAVFSPKQYMQGLTNEGNSYGEDQGEEAMRKAFVFPAINTPCQAPLSSYTHGRKKANGPGSPAHLKKCYLTKRNNN